MFNDWHFSGQRYTEKIGLYHQFKSDVVTTKAKLSIIALLLRINSLAEHSTALILIDKAIKHKLKKRKPSKSENNTLNYIEMFIIFHNDTT
jgi:hypothetical protein